MWKFLKIFLISSISTVCTFITLVQFFLGTTTFTDFINAIKESTNIFDYVTKTNFIISTSILIIIFIFSYQLLEYFRKAKISKKSGENFHRFLNDVRNETFKTKDLNSSNPPANHEEFYTSMQSKINSACEKIHEFLEYKTKKDFAICIKFLKNIEQNDAIEKYTYTVCRYGNDKEKRIKNARLLSKTEIDEDNILQPVKNNTAFEDILNGDKDYFTASNLFMIKLLGKITKDRKYKNPNQHFWKYYLSTIVVPIRIHKKFLPNLDSDYDVYSTIGFLCIDYRWPISKALKEEVTEYIKGFADAFFVYTYEIKNRDEIIAKNENM